MTLFSVWVIVAVVLAVTLCISSAGFDLHEVVIISVFWPASVCIVLWNWLVEGCYK